MEPNLSGKQNDKIDARNTRAADQSVQPKLNQSSDGLPQDPVYNVAADRDRDKAKAKIGESYEGFSASKGAGIPNLEKSDGFGSKYQMPGPDMSEKYMDKSESAGEVRPEQLTAGTEVPHAEGFVDLQTTVHMIQDLVLKIRENLQSTEQEELEALLKQGAQLLSANWKQLSSIATEQVSTLKIDVKENPYRTVITALKVGMALGQVISANRREMVAEPVVKDDENLGHVTL